MIGQKNITTMFVSNQDAIAPVGSTPAELVAGQVGVFVDGKAVDAAPGANTKVVIVGRNAEGSLVTSQAITQSEFYNETIVGNTPATQQVTYIGYNGASGAIVATDETDYVAHIFVADDSKTFGVAAPVIYAAYYSGIGATELSIAAGFAANLNKNVHRMQEPLLSASVVTADAGTAPGAATYTFTQGSKVVGCTAASGIPVGDFIAPAAGAPVYKVVGFSGDNIILDYPFMEASTSGDETAVVTVAAASSDAAGIKLTSKPTTQFKPGVIKYSVPHFDVTLQVGFGATPVETTQKASKGQGTYESVAYNEWFLSGNSGEAWRVGNYPKEKELLADPAVTYDILTIDYKDKSATTIDRDVESFATIMLAGTSASVTAIAGLLGA